jgi:RNA polymerase sigma-70 factor (family 1)
LSATTLHNERELLLTIAKGDEKAFRKLFNHYWNHIYSVAFTFTKSIVLSEEVVQDVFLKIWLKREQLTSIINFKGYLFTVARNHIYNELRKKSCEQSFVKHLEEYFIEMSSLPEEKLFLKETQYLINEAVAHLPVQQRTVYELSRNAGLDHAQIADKLGISKLTVKSHMNKALRLIRQTYQSSTGELLCILFIVMTCK